MSSLTAAKVTSQLTDSEFDQLFRDHYQLVYRTAFSVTRSAEDAEDVLQEAFLKAFENLRLCLSVLHLSVRTVNLRTDRFQEAASDSFMGATDLADFLVMKGIPFRSAHEIVARAVRAALDEHKQLHEMDLAAFSPFFLELPADYLAPENIVARKNSG